MKICPKCKAEIQENARFCLYCMTSFEDKQNIENKNKDQKLGIYIAICILVAILIGCAVFFIVNGKEDSGEISTSGQSETDGNYSENTEYSAPSEQSEGHSGGNSYYPSSSGNYVPSNNQGGYQPNYNPSGSSGNNNNIINSSQNSSGSLSTVSQPSASSQPSEPSSSPSSSESVSSSSTSTPSGSAVSYSYRAAQYGDDYNYYANIPENAIVIMKVNTASSNGVYEIPSSIDGKPVIAIMENAFGAANVKNTVKTVIIPASIKTIWSYGFFYCNNLKEIYIKGEALFIGDSPFPPVSRRTETITIYCSSTCHNRNFTKWKNLAEYNNAVYKEWNG